MRHRHTQGVRPGGRFRIESRGADGRQMAVRYFDNGTTAQGVTYLAARGFLGAAAFTTFYIGLINDAGFSTLSVLDTHQSHPGWAEWTAMFGSVRQPWAPTAAAGALLDAPNAILSVTASGLVRGAFLASTPVIGSASGQIIYAAGVDTTGLPVEPGGVVTVGYKLRLSPR